MALISVISPVYNTEKLLPRCLESILSQAFQDFEVILVNDGSKDNSASICETYAAKDSRIHVIHQNNSGVSAARNAALDWVMENSDSKWILFVDSDDWVQAAIEVYPCDIRLLYILIALCICLSLGFKCVEPIEYRKYTHQSLYNTTGSTAIYSTSFVKEPFF